MLRSVSDADFHLVYTGESDGLRSTSEPYYYIYNIGEDGGFVMVSGDDRVDAVIGYGLSGAFDPNKIPANMAGWFKEYERQIDFARTLPERVFPETSTKAAASDSLPNRVEPLITTQWDQLTPYNLLCPMVGYQRTPTGCGATAMAQILNYHKWPERATGTGSYTVPELGGDTTYVDLSQFTFDWANMADVYDENATTEQREAVAELMFAAGAAINMVYSTTWSYSQYNQIPEGFVTHMGYDENLAYLMRNCYDSDSWESTIKKELAEKRPVFYMAQSIRDGHYFVCDGYVSSPGQGDYFHINWGWGGMRNNYFRLDLLNEYDVEGNMTGYSWDQVALVGIQKPTDSSERIEKVAMVRFEPEEDYIAQGNTLHLSYDYQYSGSILTRRLQHGFAIYTDNGQEVGSLENELEIIPQYNYWYRERWRITDLRLDPGTYKVRMLYRFEGDEEWKEIWRSEYLRTISAFYNTAGGRFIVGRRDDGTFVGVQDVKGTLKSVSDSIQNVLGISVTVRSQTFDDKVCIVVDVPMGRNKIDYDGRFYKRVGNTTHLIRREELKDIISEERGTFWMDEPCDFTPADIVQTAISSLVVKGQGIGRIPKDVDPEGRDCILSRYGLVNDRIHLLFKIRFSAFALYYIFRNIQFFFAYDHIPCIFVHPGHLSGICPGSINNLRSIIFNNFSISIRNYIIPISFH